MDVKDMDAMTPDELTAYLDALPDEEPEETRYVVYMESDVYGRERFVYNSADEAEAGYQRLRASVNERQKEDKIRRFLSGPFLWDDDFD